MRKLEDIINNDLCLGCGLCSAISSTGKMKLQPDGFYRPQCELTKSEEQLIVNLCPGINVRNTNDGHSSIWGKVDSVVEAWAVDEDIRHYSSSGGVTTALCLYLLECQKVDAILQVGVNDDSNLYNSLKVSRNKDDVIKCSSSRYAPASVFDNIFRILDDSKDVFAMVGKPCDIACMRNIITAFPQYKGRIKYFLSIFCAGMPSYNATLQAIDSFGRKNEKPSALRYRGNGWPGCFEVKFADGTSYSMTYTESWSKILGRQLCFRCKICPDGIGLLADISSGDAWNTKNGYPDFTESKGKNFCFIRTKEGHLLFEEAVKSGYIEKKSVDISNIRNMQSYQYDRRRLVGWRLLVVQMMTQGLLSFKGLGIRLALLTRPQIIVAEVIGTFKRLKSVRIKRSKNK